MVVMVMMSMMMPMPKVVMMSVVVMAIVMMVIMVSMPPYGHNFLVVVVLFLGVCVAEAHPGCHLEGKERRFMVLKQS